MQQVDTRIPRKARPVWPGLKPWISPNTIGKASNQMYRIPYMREMYKFIRSTTGSKKHNWNGLTSASNRTPYQVVVNNVREISWV